MYYLKLLELLILKLQLKFSAEAVILMNISTTIKESLVHVYCGSGKEVKNAHKHNVAYNHDFSNLNLLNILIT